MRGFRFPRALAIEALSEPRLKQRNSGIFRFVVLERRQAFLRPPHQNLLTISSVSGSLNFFQTIFMAIQGKNEANTFVFARLLTQ